MPFKQFQPVGPEEIQRLQSNLSMALIADGRQAEAIPILESLWKVNKSPQTAYNLAVAYRQTGQRHFSLKFAKETYKMDNTTNTLYAEELLFAGDWKKGWGLYNHNRYTKDDIVRAYHLDKIPEWHGERNANLLVVGEGGLGDHVCFSRWMDRLPAKWSLLVQDNICWFYGHTKWKEHLCTEPLDITHWTTTYSLPKIGLPIPPATRLYVPTSDNGKIGLCWQAGEPLLNGKKLRSLTEERAIKLVRSFPQYEWVNLQHGWQSPWENPDIANFEDMLKVVAGLKAIVSVDTFTMHLAGTLGKPLIVLLGDYVDWKLGRFRDSWYPQAKYTSALPDLILSDLTRYLAIY